MNEAVNKSSELEIVEAPPLSPSDRTMEIHKNLRYNEERFQGASWSVLDKLTSTPIGKKILESIETGQTPDGVSDALINQEVGVDFNQLTYRSRVLGELIFKDEDIQKELEIGLRERYGNLNEIEVEIFLEAFFREYPSLDGLGYNHLKDKNNNLIKMPKDFKSVFLEELLKFLKDCLGASP